MLTKGKLEWLSHYKVNFRAKNLTEIQTEIGRLCIEDSVNLLERYSITK